MIGIRNISIPSRIRKAGAVIVLAIVAAVLLDKVVLPDLRSLTVLRP